MIFDHFNIFIKFHSAVVTIAACIRLLRFFFLYSSLRFCFIFMSQIFYAVCVCMDVFIVHLECGLDLILDEIRNRQSQRHACKHLKSERNADASQ